MPNVLCININNNYFPGHIWTKTTFMFAIIKFMGIGYCSIFIIGPMPNNFI